MYRIFIVEDDRTIAQAVAHLAENWGLEVRCVRDFRAVTAEAAEFQPHLIILDIALPCFDGYHWCRELRKQTSAPILFLSSAGDNMNVIMAMNFGADDFIAKPFDGGVLMAKVQAMLRRSYDMAAPAVLRERRGAQLSADDQKLTYQGQTVELTKNEYRILSCLMESAGKVVSREKLMQRLWETDSFVDENTLTVNVNRLRRKLAGVGLVDFIATRHGVGYADSTRVTQLHFLPLEDYNAATGQSLTLNDGQVYVAALRTDFPYDTLTVDGEWTFRVMDRDIPPLSGPFTADITPTLMVVMPHFTQFVQELEDGLSEKYGWYLTATWHYAFDTDLPENQQGNIDGTTPNLEDALNGYLASVSSDWGVGVSVESKAANRADFYGMYGGLFFLGIMLSIVFIFAAVAILYYKQLSEGYEDQSRFDIMQKVGMTKQDIRRSINSQLLTVFYLPLVLAGVHLCFAFPFIHKLLILFNLDNRGLLIGTTAVSFAVFAVLYAIVYKLTGNTYYRIVAEDTEKE